MAPGMTTDGSKASFEQRIQALRAERGDQVKISEVGEVVASIMATMQGDITPTHLRLYKELDDLATYIQHAKSEIAALCPGDIRYSHLPAATDQLDAIVEQTEKATHTILDAVEKIEEGASKQDVSAISEQVTRIFEACGFQDLTGQRISKVVGTLKFIEERLDQLLDVFGDELVDARKAAAQCEEDSREGDHHLLDGPQLPEEANKQEEIDALLASFD